MPDVFFDNPPVLQGDERTQLRQLSSYLYTISSKLNEAMMSVSIQEAQIERQIQEKAGQQEEEKSDTSQYEALKSMIVKSAEIIRTEMEEISTELNKQTEAISEQFGKFEENIDLTIRATAEGVLQDYHYEETVRDVNDSVAFKRHTNQYIFTGIINEITKQVGLAIGEGVTAYDQDGNAYLNQNAKLVTITADKMSFWQGDVEMAYFSSGRFYITHGELLETLKVGKFSWKIMSDDSLTLVTR